MKLRILSWAGTGAVLLLLAGAVGWLVSLPSATPVTAQPAISEDEARATLAALRPPKRQRPLVAVVGINNATETTDYLMPLGILRRAGVADVMALATRPGPVTLMPALKVQPDATTAEFDARYPEGADYVVVPAMMPSDDPEVLRWINRQAERHAIIIGICAGAEVLGAAGLLDGRRATAHWYSLPGLRKAHPTMRYVADRRFVVDRSVATTTGITASMPMMLTLIEAIAGREKAETVGRELGLPAWDARHDSGAFALTRPFALTAAGNTLAFWRYQRLGIALRPGMDEIALALVADAWSRTFRSGAVTVSATESAVRSREGVLVLADGDEAGTAPLPPPDNLPPMQALDETLRAIGKRYGERTTDAVARQLEYPRPATAR
jgi:putative intracellular protease/amidase